MNIFTRTLTELKGPTATPARHWRAAWETCACLPAMLLLWLQLRRLTAALGCPVVVYPGENEMAALAKGALRVLSGREIAQDYPPQG